MRRAVLLAALAALAATSGPLAGRAGAQGSQPPTAEILPPALVLPAPPRPVAVPKKVPRPTIKAVDTKDSLEPDIHGAAPVEGAATAVKVADGTMTAKLTASSNAYAYVGGHASGVAPIRLVQVFDVVPGDPRTPWVALAMAAKVDGYLRTERNGAACLRVARAAIYPACGGPGPWLAFPPACIGPCQALRYTRNGDIGRAVIPAGRYVLVADLVIEATVDGIFHGRGEAAFSPTAYAWGWSADDDPFEGVARKDFGLTVIVKVAPAP